MTVPKSGSKYDARTCPPYQVSHTICQAGKLFTGTKHRVTFAFGFADPDALRQGMTGPEARGEEHEVKLVWSHTSGKRQVIADGQEVHFSIGKILEPTFETSWTMEGGHALKIVGHATPALFSNTPEFRQFDLFLDGMSFFSMPKIYELGQNSQNRRDYSITTPSKGRPMYHHLEEKQVSYSTPEGRDFAQAPTRDSDNPRRVADDISEPGKRLSSVGSPTGVMDMPNAQAQDFFWSDGQQQDLLESVAVPQLHSARDEFSPVEAPHHQSPSFALATNQILSAYGPAPTNIPVNGYSTASALVLYGTAPHAVPSYYDQASPHHYTHHPRPDQQQFDAQPTLAPAHYTPSDASYHAHQQQYYQQPMMVQCPTPTTLAIESHAAGPNTPVVKLTMAPLTVEDIEDSCAPPLTGMSKVVNSLVNLDDITEKKASPEDRKFQEKKQQTNRQVKSKLLPPKQPNWSLGLEPNLQSMKEHAPVKSTPTKEIMRPHAFDPNAVHAGMMVAYGSHPSLQAQPVMMHHGPSFYR